MKEMNKKLEMECHDNIHDFIATQIKIIAEEYDNDERAFEFILKLAHSITGPLLHLVADSVHEECLAKRGETREEIFEHLKSKVFNRILYKSGQNSINDAIN